MSRLKKHKSILLSAALLLVTACQHSAQPIASSDVQANVRVDKASQTSINQISATQTALAQKQIAPTSVKPNLTVEQLKNYVDRCLPGRTLPVPAEIDCSEIGLRVNRTFRSEDKVAEAVIILNRISKSGLIDDFGVPGDSLRSQSIAGQLYQDANTPLPPDPIVDFSDFLEAQGLELTGGEIIIGSEGGS